VKQDRMGGPVYRQSQMGGMTCPYGRSGRTGGMSLHGRVGMWGIGARGKLRRSRSGYAAWIYFVGRSARVRFRGYDGEGRFFR